MGTFSDKSGTFPRSEIVGTIRRVSYENFHSPRRLISRNDDFSRRTKLSLLRNQGRDQFRRANAAGNSHLRREKYLHSPYWDVSEGKNAVRRESRQVNSLRTIQKVARASISLNFVIFKIK